MNSSLTRPRVILGRIKKKENENESRNLVPGDVPLGLGVDGIVFLVS